MKKILLYWLVLLPTLAYSQVDTTKSVQDINAYGFRWMNGKFRGSFVLPTDTFTLKVADSGAIAYKGGHYWGWSGHKWLKIDSATAGSGGGGGCSNCSADSITKKRMDTSGMALGDTIRYMYYDPGSGTFKLRRVNLPDVIRALGYAPVAMTDTSWIISTKAWRQKGLDSLMGVINGLLQLKKNASDSGIALQAYVTRYWLYHVLDSLNLLVSYTNYRAVGGGGHQLWNFSTAGNQSTLTFRQIRDSGDVVIVDAGDSGFVIYVAPKMNNYGNAPGQVEFPYASIPAATAYPTGTTLIVPDSGFHYVDTGSGGSRGWKKISGGGSGSSVLPANPSATIGLTAVNGSAGTYTRSDAAPPLSQAIVPTWTGVHTFNLPPIYSGLSGYLKGNNASAITASTTIPATDLSGALQAAQEPVHTGDVTNTAGSLNLVIGTNKVGNTQLAQMIGPSIKGVSTAGAANPSDLTPATVAAMLQSYISFPSILFKYNVVDGGADSTGNNATTTRKAIQKTINLAAASPLPAAVVFPSGNYLIDSTIVIPKAMAIEGYNAYVIASDATPYDMFKILADSVRLRGLKLFGVSKAQVGIDINGYKYFSYRDGEASSLRYGFRARNTSSTYNAGDLDGCNFFGDSVGVFPDTLGEYVTVRGGLMKGNTVAVWDRGGNNSFIGNNVNFNSTAFKFTGESNNSHGIIDGVNANHNSVSFDVNGAVYGETVTNSHFYEGDMNFVSSSNWRFINTIYAPANLKIWQCAWMDFSESHPEFTYGLNLNLQGNFTPPTFSNNFGPAVINMTTVNPTMNYPMDSLGGYPYRKVLTGDTLELGIARWWYKSLSANDTIKRIIHPTLGRTYRVEVQANGYNMVMLDNAKVDGTFNPSAALNVFTLECIDAGADPRFIVRVSQPGVLVARSTTNVGWGRPTGQVTISGGNITKTGPDALSFTGWAVPDKALASGDGYYSFQAISTYANIIAGFSKTAAQNSYNNMDFGIYFFGSSGGANNINIAENGTLISSGLGGTNWSTNDSFRVKRTGTTITYEKYSGGAWNVFYTSTHSSATTDKLFPQVAIRALTTFTNPRIIGTNVINNMTDQAFIAPYGDGQNATSSSGSGTSGIYFPTIVNSSNAASITSDSAIWSRTDNTVTVSGHCTITPTSGSANTIIDITVPVNSLLSGGKGLWGNGMTSQTTNGGIGCVISSSGTANIAHATIYQTGGTTAFQLYYSYQYRVQ
jgi:hypothetical protein